MHPATSHTSPTTIGDLTERQLIARIREQAGAAPEWLLVPIGDDAAVIEPERNRADVVTVDALVEGIHFDRRFVPAAAIGHRALAVNLSDLAAMGAAPRYALLSMALPPALLLADFDAIIDGVTALASRHHTFIVGGNLTRSPGPLVIDVAAVGTVKPRQALTRRGARPGDEVYVSGTIGSAAAGLLQLKGSLEASGTPSPTAVPPAVQPLIDRYVRPEPRVRLGTLLARNRAATACMDLSDGLSDAVYQVAEASGVGIIVDAGAVPIDPAARDVFASRGLDPVTAAIVGGDDYELLACVRPRTRRRLAAALRHGGAPLTKIGVCTPGRDVVLQTGTGAIPLPRGGFSHFGAA